MAKNLLGCVLVTQYFSNFAIDERRKHCLDAVETAKIWSSVSMEDVAVNLGMGSPVVKVKLAEGICAVRSEKEGYEIVSQTAKNATYLMCQSKARSCVHVSRFNSVKKKLTVCQLVKLYNHRRNLHV